MAVYDPEKEKTTAKPSHDGSHDDLGTHPERREAEVADLEKQFQNSPDSGASSGGATSEELGKVRDEDDGDWDTNVDDSDGKQSRKALFKRLAVSGGAVGILAGGLLGFFSLASGPLQFMHISQMFQGFHFGNNESFMSDRNRNLYTYMRNYTNGDRHVNRLGNTATKVAERYESRLKKQGIEIVYDKGAFGTVDGFRVNPDTPAGQRLVREARAVNLSVSEDNFIQMPRGSGNTRQSRALIRKSIESTDMGKLSSAMSKRLLTKRAGVSYHPLNNKAREVGQSTVDYVRGVHEERAKRISDGADGDLRVPRPDQETQDADANSKQLADEADDIAQQLADVDAADSQAVSRLAQIKNSMLVKGGTAAVAIIGVACSVQALGNEAEQLQYEKTLLPMMRSGMEFVSIGSQVATAVVADDPKVADINWDQLGAINELLYDENAPEGERSFFSAQSIQAEQGKAQTGPDLPDGLKPSSIEGKPAWLAALDAIPGLSGACSVQNTISNWPVIKQVGDLTGAIVGAVIPIDQLMDLIVGVLAGDVEVANARGALLGNVSNYGALLAANDSAISMGGSAMSTAEVYARDMQTKQERLDDRKDDSVFARYLDLSQPDSLAAKTLFETEEMQSPKTTLASIVRSPLAIFQGAGNSLATAFSPSATAQSSIYSYGVPEYGFTAEEMANPLIQDPFANADYIESGTRLQDLNNEYGECFGTTVDTSGKLVTQDTRKYSQTTKCNDAKGNQELLRYRFYIADTIAMKVLTCYEINEECDQVGFGASQQSPNAGAGGGLGVSADGFVFPLQTTQTIVKEKGWCWQSDTSCHHNYNAADIFAATGTPVVAARGGTVVSAKDNDGSSVGARVTIKGDDGLLYYYTHMLFGSIRVTNGQTVTAGQQLGQVGTDANAQGTPSHLHLDILPSNYDSRPSCSYGSCAGIPFINPQPALKEAFANLPQ